MTSVKGGRVSCCQPLLLIGTVKGRLSGLSTQFGGSWSVLEKRYRGEKGERGGGGGDGRRVEALRQPKQFKQRDRSV